MTAQDLRYVIPEGTMVHVVLLAKDGHPIRSKHVLREALSFRDRGWQQENRDRWGFVVRKHGRDFTIWANIEDIRIEDTSKQHGG